MQAPQLEPARQWRRPFLPLTLRLLKRLDVLSVGQGAVKHHTEVYRMVIVGQGSAVHRDIKIALDVLVVKLKGSSGSLRRAQL